MRARRNFSRAEPRSVSCGHAHAPFLAQLLHMAATLPRTCCPQNVCGDQSGNTVLPTQNSFKHHDTHARTHARAHTHALHARVYACTRLSLLYLPPLLLLRTCYLPLPPPPPPPPPPSPTPRPLLPPPFPHERATPPSPPPPHTRSRSLSPRFASLPPVSLSLFCLAGAIRRQSWTKQSLSQCSIRTTAAKVTSNSRRSK